MCSEIPQSSLAATAEARPASPTPSPLPSPACPSLGSYSWVHVTGDTTKKRAFLTEGPLKGDVASYLAHDALFVCIGGVNAIRGLKDTLKDLGATQVVEAMDMDQMTNPNVRNAILAMRKEVQAIKGLKYTKYTWDPAYKGVDDYLLSRVTAM